MLKYTNSNVGNKFVYFQIDFLDKVLFLEKLVLNNGNSLRCNCQKNIECVIHDDVSLINDSPQWST